MKTSYIDVAGEWGIVLCYDFGLLDADEMAAMMNAFGMEDVSIEEAVRILLGVNTGMCVSRSDIRMSLVFIGSTSSEEQFWDTVVHELYHASCALCDYYDVAHDSEGFAWTIGYLVRKAVGLLAPPCK